MMVVLMGLPCIVFLVSPLASVGRLSAGWGTPERGLSETAAASLQQVEAVSTLGLSHPWLAASAAISHKSGTEYWIQR